MAVSLPPPSDQEIVRMTRTLMSAHASVVSASRDQSVDGVRALIKARQELHRIKRQWAQVTGVPM